MNKLQSDTVTEMLVSSMAYNHNGGDRARATEPQFSLPAGVITAVHASRFKCIWTTLFDHYAGGPE